MMKRFTRADGSINKKQNAKRIEELEQERDALKKEVEELRHEIANTSFTFDSESPDVGGYLKKLNDLEAQVLELRKKLEGQSQLLKQKQKSDEMAKLLQDEIARIKSQKVQLQHKIKKESVQFRSWKTAQEKEALQLKKEGRRTEYELRKLLDSNQRLKLVLVRKTEEASVATERLKELLKSRKASSRPGNCNNPRLQAIENEVKMTEMLNKVRVECERQAEARVGLAEEAAKAKEEADMLIQKKLWCMLQDKEADCREKDSELSELNEKVAELSNLVEQLKMKGDGYTQVQASEGLGSTLISDSGGSKADVFGSAVTDESEVSGVLMANNITTESNEPAAKKGDLQGGKTSSSGEIVEASERPAAAATCCSCSKKSLCKTTKCKCRASGGTCGISCGCASTKCSNRATVLVKGLPQSEITGDLTYDDGSAVTVGEPVEGCDKICGAKSKQLCDIRNKEMVPKAKPIGRRSKISH